MVTLGVGEYCLVKGAFAWHDSVILFKIIITGQCATTTVLSAMCTNGTKGVGFFEFRWGCVSSAARVEEGRKG